MKATIDSNGNHKIKFKDRYYFILGQGIISDENALEIYEKLLKETQDPQQCKRTQSQWKDDETMLF